MTYCWTLSLSVEAFQLRFTCVVEDAVAVRPVGVVGAVVSPPRLCIGLVVISMPGPTLTDPVAPEASAKSTVSAEPVGFHTWAVYAEPVVKTWTVPLLVAHTAWV